VAPNAGAEINITNNTDGSPNIHLIIEHFPTERLHSSKTISLKTPRPGFNGALAGQLVRG
jgi:hypothetical protein